MKSIHLLSTTLKVNASFSLLSGIVLIAFHQYWLAVFEINFPFYAIGIGLLLFAWHVFRVANQKPISLKAAKQVIIMDVSWVVMSIIVLFAGDGISVTGQWLIGIVAAFVADFAIFQMIGIKNLSGAGNAMQGS
ncbi:hypothetical protein QQ020_01290 [Fulvivirgaceae bacterium BMA12]|uniref:Uncharacterized protein n=1 Tax=Agaribacillus aureus TaxID=3051825 RepID=A0ABT8L2E8_9BACT|nr:hypothetical protein [Fulvivirgaceae bacterium BMA12]